MSEKKILVVDDDQNNVSLLTTALEQSGFEVSSASDGEEGLQKIKQNIPDLILLDVMMPKMNGPQMAQILKEDSAYRNIPIIYLTSLLEEEKTSSDTREVEEKYFIPKPFDLKRLLALIQKILENK